MAAGTHDLTIEQGAYFELAGTLYVDDAHTEPFDFTGYTMRGQIRKKAHGELLATFECTLGGAAGTWAAVIGATDTAEIPATNATHTWVYDLELVPPGGEDAVERFLMGSVTVSAEVTVDG